MKNKGQGALEYLLLLAGAILIGVIVVGVLISLDQQKETQEGQDIDFSNQPITFEYNLDENVIGELVSEPIKIYDCGLETYGFEFRELGENYFKQNRFSTWEYAGTDNRGIHLFWASKCITVPEEFREFGEKFKREIEKK